MRSLSTLALTIALLCTASPAAVAAPSSLSADVTTPSSSHSGAAPSVHALYPDPVTGGDRGEFIVLDVPAGTPLDSYTITDGQTTAALPNVSTSGKIAVTADPTLVRNLTDIPVYELDSRIELANGGDSVTLRHGNQSRSTVRYSKAVEGEIGVVTGSTIRWRPLGATDRPVVTGAANNVTAFTLPDAPTAPIAPIRAAKERVYLAGYTLSSDRVADALITAHERGADVRVLLEGEPVGSRTRAEAQTLDRLADAGVTVRLIAGPYARYRYHHAKYVVADDRAVVLTENWKPAGTGGNSSRGWGVGTSQQRIVDALATTFRADADWRAARNWSGYRQGHRFERGEPAIESYPSRFEPATVPVDRTTLLVTPDNAQRELVARLDAATDSITVVQPTVGSWDEPLLRALRRAASRGVEVRLLLSSAWYVREENRKTAERFTQWAQRRDVPLKARLAKPGDRYEKIHAKGAIIDGEHVVLGSLNWNEQAATENREVVLVLSGSKIANYYGRVFDADWGGGNPTLPVGILSAIGGGLVLAGLAARRIRFAGERT